MRVVAGTARGLRLIAPRGGDTRPITDRVKETLFAILGERVIDAEVLDLYAGSGAIGIEALSRGAAHCTFVERGREGLTSIRRNLEHTRLEAAATVVGGDVLRFLEAAPVPRADLVVLDPPYAERAILAPLRLLQPHLAPGATVAVKHHWRTAIDPPPGLHAVRQRRFGETTLTFLEHGDPSQAAEDR